MKTILRAEKIESGYGNRQVLHAVSLEVRQGERVLLVGPNGCGKTTLLKNLSGVLPIIKGSIFFDGKDVTTLPTHLRVQRGMGYLLQTRNVFPSLTIEENLHLGYWHGTGSFSEQKDWFVELFPMLKDKLNRRTGLLSGGERQALAVGITLSRPLRLLLLDEPTSGLSPSVAVQILEAIQHVQQKTGFACVIVEHGLKRVQPWASRVLVMNKGQIVAEETQTSRILDREWLQRYYFE